MSPRRISTLVLACALLAAACTSTPVADPEPAPTGDGSTGTSSPGLASVPAELRRFVKPVCSLPTRHLVRTWRGYDPDRSGQIMLLSKKPHTLGSGLPHVGPWDFLTDVPMFWYGPGHIRAQGKVRRPVTSAGIAPTQAALLGLDQSFPDGQPMREALVPEEERGDPPKLVVVWIWDGSGHIVLDEYPDAWPNLEALIPEGTWYENADVGSSPTSSAQIHATIGTGAFPRNHLVVGHQMRIGNKILPPWRDGPDLLEKPTFADLYDRARDNEPVVGMVGTSSIQMGMLGHGSFMEGGDKDLAILREAEAKDIGLAQEGDQWNLSPDFRRYYSFPEYANSLRPLIEYVRELDGKDGALDGKWLGRDFEDEALQGGFHTPARVPYQTRLVQEVIEREGFGADDVPDVLYLNYKFVDYVGHLWPIGGPEMRDALEANDAALPRMIRILNRAVGTGEWAMLVTADHGVSPAPESVGGIKISAGKIHEVIQSFDTDGDDVTIDRTVKPTEILINENELRENGATLGELADAIARLTQEDVKLDDTVEVPNPNARVFRAVYPSALLESLPCLEGVVNP